MDGSSVPPVALLPTRSKGCLTVTNTPHCADRKPGSATPRWHQTSMATLVNSAGQEHRWEGPDKQSSGAHGTFTTINWVPKHLTKS